MYTLLRKKGWFLVLVVMTYYLLDAIKSGMPYKIIVEYTISMLIIAFLLEHKGVTSWTKSKKLTAQEANKLLQGATDYLTSSIYQLLTDKNELKDLNITFEIKDNKGQVLASLNCCTDKSK